MEGVIFDPLQDGISRLELIQHCGDDKMIVDAARVSYDKDRANAPFEKIKDSKLIKYMLTNQHGTPFEHNAITLHFVLPIFVARQFIRHRIGWSYNEISGRYVELPELYYTPKEWRGQDSKNKQGSISGSVDRDIQLVANSAYAHSIDTAFRVYKSMLNIGVAKEMARFCLPVSTYTRWYATANLRSIMLFYSLRADSHAQWESRQYAIALSEIMIKLFPVTWKIFLDLIKDKESRKAFIKTNTEAYDLYCAEMDNKE